jgi:hypothetical protein
VDDGRARMNSDPYFNLGQTGGFIGLLDTGVRFSHVQFNSPDHVDFARDCVNGGAKLQHRRQPQPQRRLLESRHVLGRDHHRQRPIGRGLPGRDCHHPR